MIRHNKKLLIEVSATVVLLRPKGMETWRRGAVWNGFHAVKTHRQESPSVMELAPMARSSQGCPCAGEWGWVEGQGEDRVTWETGWRSSYQVSFEVPLLTQGLAHQQGAFQNSWVIMASFLGMFLFLLIIEESISKVCICSCQLIKMCLSPWMWSARTRPVKNRSFYL